MLSKKILFLGFSIAFISAGSALADGLTVQSSGINDGIKISCNGLDLPTILEPNSILSNVAWQDIAIIGSNLSCDFSLDNATQDKIGSAQININDAETQGEVENVSFVPGYKTVITPGQGMFETSTSVEVMKG